MDNRVVENNRNIVPELYFLITKFLANGPFKHVGEMLIREIQATKILPNRHDWMGEEHEQTYTELERKYSHIGPNHLLEICARITDLLDKDIAPSVTGVTSLLGAGRQSVLRTETNIAKPKALIDYCTRIRSMPVLDAVNRKYTHNIVKVLLGREAAGPLTRKLAIPNQFHSKTQLLRRTLGHLSSVYCVLFDRTGKYIITGADDFLVKLWSAIDGRLLFTYRGASAEITDIAINLENTLLAAGSLDHILRVWDLHTAGPIAVLCSHTGMITSVNFCPSPRDFLKYLVTTSTDGSVAFWQYSTSRDGKTTFASKPNQYHEKLRPGQAQMIFASFSPGGLYLAAGSADHHVRVYLMSEEGPKRILETEAHSDTVDSIQWAHNGLRFISGSKDGSAHVWHFESQQWKSLRLQMSERLPSCPPPADENKKLKVTMVGWDLTDKLVVTAVNDFTIKVWHADTGKLHRVMRGHTDELYVLESHPKDPHIMISAGHDGKLFIWDIMEGISLASFSNDIQGQGHGGVFDAKWSPDGMMIAATDSHGHILMYGLGSGHQRLKTLPTELFFHTDYRPLIRDSNHFVMDEQTQTVPHLMPPPFLVDIDGNPYPPKFQRLVPGRESCTADQLVPNISVGPEGVEVVEGPNSVLNIDRMIAALANRQGAGEAPQERNDAPENVIFGGNVGGAHQIGISPGMAAAAAADNRLNNVGNNNVAAAVNNNGTSPRARVVLRRLGDVEGVRQSVGNWQRGISNFKWLRRSYVRPMQHSRLVALKQAVYSAGQIEMEIYRREMRRRPIMISTSSPNSSTISRGPTRLRGRHIGRTRSANTLRPSGLNASGSAAAASSSASRPSPVYRTRAVLGRAPFRDDDDDDHSVSSASSDSSDGTVAEDQISSGSSSSDSESSDYSDWVGAAEQPRTLEPPVRSKRKRVKPRSYSPSGSPSNSRAAGPSSSMRKKLPIGDNGEIPEEYRPPEWLSEVIPRKAPYYPQMGDEVVYFRQGHQRYLEAVRSKNVYKLNQNCEPWQNLDLRDHEVVKVIGIKYEIRPPRLCCLKLALMNNDGTLTNQSFAIKYHDMADVIDFIVLKQTFDTAVRRLWTPGDRFRCMIDDGWWMGQIVERKSLDEEFPDSLFMCFNVRWDNGEFEFMSPWDMEPIDDNRLPEEIGGVVVVHQEELRATLYQPTAEEWPRGDREASCRRIIAGLDEVMMLAIADPFLAPVDLNIYPSYAFIVEYPIDLATIKARFENHFYRRITSAQFDVRYLATNAEKFNQSDSHIVKHARIITDLCLRIIKDHNEVDVRAVYHQLCDTYVTSDSDDDNRAGTSTGGVTPSGRTRRSRSKQIDWRPRCREILEVIWNSSDSVPFREPVDSLEHPDYLQIIDTPMDLRTIKEDLLGGNYDSATSFIKDMRRIFSNSRSYNTNRQSRIYKMTQDLSNLFEEHIKLFKRGLSGKSNGTERTRQNARRRARVLAASASGQSPAPSAPRHYRRLREIVDDDDDDAEIDVINGDTPSTSSARRPLGRPRKSNPTNGVSSTHNLESTPGPSTSSSSRRRTATTTTPRRNVEDGSDTSSSGDSTDSSSSEAEATDGSSVRVGDSGNVPKSMSARKRARNNSDSEESYRPTQQKRKNGTVRKAKPKLNGTKRANTSRRCPTHDDDDDDDEIANGRQNGHRKQNGATPAKRGRPRKYLRSDDEQPAEDGGDDENTAADEQVDSEEATDGDEQNNESANDEEVEDEDEEDDDDDDEEAEPTGLRRRKYDSDQSYRQSPAPNRSARQRALQSDDSDTALARPTRSAAKRLKAAWGQEEDSLESPHDDEVAVSQQPSSSRSHATSSRHASGSTAQEDRRRRSRRKIFADDGDAEAVTVSQPVQAASSSSSRSFRSARLNENRLRTASETVNGHRAQDNDDSDSDSDTVLSQLARPSSRFKRKTYQRSAVSNTTSNSASISTNAVSNGLHRTREVLRRRMGVASITTTTSTTTSTSLLLHNNGTTRTTNNSAASALAAISEATRIQRSQVQEDHNYGEPGPSTLRHSRRTTMLSRHQRNPDELDMPMTSAGLQINMAVDPLHIERNEIPIANPNISGRLRHRSANASSSRMTNNHTTNSVAARNTHADDSEDDVSDPEDNKPLGQMVLKSPLRERNAARPPPPTATRVSRTQKRPHYNEESDESLNDLYSNNSHHLRGAHPSKRRHADDTSSEDDGEPEISVSSRGRVRKISSKVRGYFRE